MGQRNSLILAIVLLISAVSFAGTWIMGPGKGSFASALASYTTTFPGADENPLSEGGAWTSGVGASDNVALTGNQVVGPSGTEGIGRLTTPAFANNQKATVTTFNTVIEVAPAVRIQGSADAACYIAYIFNTTTVRIYKVDSALGSVQQGADFTVTTIASGDTIGLSASGTSTTTLELFRNNVSQGTRTDSSSAYTGGQPGFFLVSTAKIDAFTATDL